VETKERPKLAPERMGPPAGITLSESGGVRYLHFGTEWVQGAMRIARPYRLELEYQQQMMAPLLLLPAPRRILQLGLGAAALTKFCHRHVKPAQTVVVELDPNVIETAHRWFGLPEDDARLTVVRDDALRFLQRPRQRGSADWLQVDLYDAQARGPVYDDTAFYVACRHALREPGVASFNLFGRHLGPSLEAIVQAFDGRVAVLKAAQAGNRIVVAVVGDPVSVDATQLRQRARAIEAQFALPAARWICGLSQPGRSRRGGGLAAVQQLSL
jgi:spermidine synthase